MFKKTTLLQSKVMTSSSSKQPCFFEHSTRLYKQFIQSILIKIHDIGMLKGHSTVQPLYCTCHAYYIASPRLFALKLYMKAKVLTLKLESECLLSESMRIPNMVSHSLNVKAVQTNSFSHSLLWGTQPMCWFTHNAIAPPPFNWNPTADEYKQC